MLVLLCLALRPTQPPRAGLTDEQSQPDNATSPYDQPFPIVVRAPLSPGSHQARAVAVIAIFLVFDILFVIAYFWRRLGLGKAKPRLSELHSDLIG